MTETHELNGPEQEEQVADKPRFVSWPPPGLERIQGTLWSILGLLVIGDGILILPLLVSVASTETRWSPGPFGNQWWILPLTTVFGLFVMLSALLRILHLLRTARRAIGMGHGRLSIAQAAIDIHKDVGFLLQGGRMYSHLDASVRAGILRLRLTGAALYSAAALWVPFGFILALFIASHGSISIGTVWDLTLLPAAILVLTAFIIRVVAGTRSGAVGLKIRKTAAEFEAASQVDDWAEDYDLIGNESVLRRGPSTGEKGFRIASIGFIVSMILLWIPILTLVIGGSFTPMITRIAIPRFQGIQEKAIRVNYLRAYRLQPDYNLTAQEAGEALHSLNMVASNGVPPDELYRTPVRIYESDWGGRIDRSGNLFERYLNHDLSETSLNYFRNGVRHPALAEFRILSRAAEADIADSRYMIPFPDDLNLMALPIPRLQSVADGARIQIVRAAMEFDTGNRRRAEQLIREVISTGFLMIDDDPHLIGNLVGIVLVNYGKEALQSFYMASGQLREAEHLHHMGEEVSQVIEQTGRVYRELDDISYFNLMASIVDDGTALRGLRWEFLPHLTTLAPIRSLHKAVFGTDPEYDQWLLDVEADLVRWPAEQELFDLSRLGWLTSPSNLKKRGFLEFWFGLVFGKSGVPGNLAASIRALNMYR